MAVISRVPDAVSRPFWGSEREFVRPLFCCIFGISVFLGAILQDAWEGWSPAFMGLSGGSWIMIAVCAASSDCRAPAGKTCRCADLHCARLFRGESGAISANERRPQSSQGKLATKKRRQSFLESVFYVPAEKALASPPHTFATAGDSAMLESCPSRPPANREGIRLRRCPVGSNAQVPANWASLQILAQSPFWTFAHKRGHERSGKAAPHNARCGSISVAILRRECLIT